MTNASARRIALTSCKESGAEATIGSNRYLNMLVPGEKFASTLFASHFVDSFLALRPSRLRIATKQICP